MVWKAKLIWCLSARIPWVRLDPSWRRQRSPAAIQKQDVYPAQHKDCGLMSNLLRRKEV